MYSGTVYLASDHAGLVLKEYIQDRLSEQGVRVVDLGAHDLDLHDDYPELIRPAAKEVVKNVHARAIVFGMSGQGEAIVANRFKRVRAALYAGGDIEIVKLARAHNDANILSLGAKFVDPETAWRAVHLFLDTSFSGDDRHVRRIASLDE